LDQGGLACAVIADQGDDLAGTHLQVDVGERGHRAELLGHALEAEDHLACCRALRRLAHTGGLRGWACKGRALGSTRASVGCRVERGSAATGYSRMPSSRQASAYSPVHTCAGVWIPLSKISALMLSRVTTAGTNSS